MKHICLDIGHSHVDGGAHNKAFDISEFTYNKELASMIEKYLVSNGFKVSIVYRESYSKLPHQINDTHADVCISLHANAFNEIASGTETLYWHSSKKSKQLASLVQDSILGALDLRDRGIKPLEGSSRGGSLLRKTSMPHVLIEPFFIDNNTDYMIADANKDELAKSIATSVEEYFK